MLNKYSGSDNFSALQGRPSDLGKLFNDHTIKENSMNNEEMQRNSESYRAAISVWKLVSDQIYSRFSAMMTANSIIVFANGWLVTQRIEAFSQPLYLAFPGIGVILSILGILFIWHGYMTEIHYRKLAYKLENACTTEHIAILPSKGKVFLYISFSVFVLFLIFYAIIIYLLMT
jgi:hypothetical protein